MKVESSRTSYNLANVYSKLGGTDTMRAEAWSRAQNNFTGVPGVSRGPPGGPSGGGLQGAPVKWNGKFTSTSKKGCSAFNSGVPHRADQLDKDGKCLFMHACDHWVSNKGPGGVCLDPKHKRDKCDNPHKSAKKL